MAKFCRIFVVIRTHWKLPLWWNLSAWKTNSYSCFSCMNILDVFWNQVLRRTHRLSGLSHESEFLNGHHSLVQLLRQCSCTFFPSAGAQGYWSWGYFHFGVPLACLLRVAESIQSKDWNIRKSSYSLKAICTAQLLFKAGSIHGLQDVTRTDSLFLVLEIAF